MVILIGKTIFKWQIEIDHSIHCTGMFTLAPKDLEKQKACTKGSGQTESQTLQVRRTIALQDTKYTKIPKCSMYGIFTYIYPKNDPVL
jgi:hypothetical protein